MSSSRHKKPFSLQKRPANAKEAQKKRDGKKFRIIYYCQFRDENDKYMTAVSTGESSKAAAEAWAYKALEDGSYNKNNYLTFEDYSQGWWNPDICEYCKDRSRTGHPLSLRYIKNSKRNLDKKILPYFKGFELKDIRFIDIKDWMNSLFDEGINPATINRNLATLKTMLKHATLMGVIPINPAKGIPAFKENPVQKTILSPEQVQLLFDMSKAQEIWEDLFYYTLNILSASTGMRLGECLALQLKNVHINEKYIEVRHSYSPDEGLKDVKNHEIRLVPLSPKSSIALESLICSNKITDPNALIFKQPERDTPPDSRTVGRYLIKALKAIGFTDKKLEKENISFHSFRHLFNTLCRSNSVPDAKLQKVTGHKTQAMTEHYTHFSLEDYQEVIKIQDDFF